MRGSVGGLRSLLVDLYPQSLTSAGLRAAVEDLAGPLRQRGITVTVDLPEPSPLSDADDRLVYRVVRECLTNVVRHARASSVQVRLETDDSGITLEIADDGVGFDPAALPAAVGAVTSACARWPTRSGRPAARCGCRPPWAPAPVGS